MLQIFLDKDDLNSGLYEGTVRGRRLFTSSAVPHGPGTIFYFNNDKFHRVNYTGQWVEGTRQGNGSTYFKDGSVYRGEYRQGVEAGEGTIRYPNGNVLEGEFIDGKIHGHAVFKGYSHNSYHRDSRITIHTTYFNQKRSEGLVRWACDGSAWGYMRGLHKGCVGCVWVCVCVWRNKRVSLAPLYYPDTLLSLGPCLGKMVDGKNPCWYELWRITLLKYPNGDQREGFFSENVLDGQVIYTRANGQIVIELWKNGERLPDRQVVVQESPSAPEETTQASLLTRTTSTSTIPPPPQSSLSQPFDLSDIRQTIRSGDRFQLKSREPKKEARMDVVALRKETDESNRDFLFKVFQRVNGSWVLIMKEKVRILWLLLVEYYIVEYIIPCLHSVGK